MNAIEIKGFVGTNLVDLFFFPIGSKGPSIFRSLFNTIQVTEAVSEPTQNGPFLSTRYKRELEEVLVDGNTTVLAGLYKDKLGAMQNRDVSYDVFLYVWYKLEKKKQ